MSEFLSVVGWEKFQHYHDRCPPWIKLYSSILSDPEFCRLRDASKAHLFCIWLLASKRNNHILADPAYIGQQIGATTKVDIGELVSAGFVTLSQQDASKLLASCYQDARLEKSRVEKETEESRVETDPPIPPPQSACDWRSDFTRFWKGYPKKVGKDKAEEAWRKKRPPIEKVMGTLAWQIVSPKWIEDGGQYIPNPATYLNQGRWQDEPPDESKIRESPEPKSFKALRDLERKYATRRDAIDVEVIE